MTKIHSFNKKEVSKIIDETSLYLIKQLNIKDSILSSYLIGYRELEVMEAVSNWLIDNWYFEITVEPSKYLFEITETLRDQLQQKAKKLQMPWLNEYD